MKVTKGTKHSRRRAKDKAVKKMRPHVPSEDGNVGHINTYGQWVSEMSRLIRESNRAAQFSFKRPLL